MVFRIRVQGCSVTQGGSTGSGAGTLRSATISLSPNPARGAVTVSYNGRSTSLTATLLTRTGMILAAPVPFRGTTVTLNLGGLPAGNYIVQLTDTRTGESVQRQVVKL